nr:reverse transcriptase domain-containing protein [Tanacetum cinerariifolium]
CYLRNMVMEIVVLHILSDALPITTNDDVTRLQALVDKKKIVISEAVIREILQLDDADGVSLSAKRTSWNEFSTTLASANQVGDLSTHTTRYISPDLTQKVIANMRWVGKGFSGVETPLFEGMLAARQLAEEGIAEEQVQSDDTVVAAVQENVAEDVTNDAIPSPPSHDIPSPSQVQSSPHQQPQSSPQAPPHGVEFPTHIQQVLDVCSALTRRVKNLKHDKAAQKLEIIKLKARGRMIDDLDKDKGIELVKDANIAETKGRHAAEQVEKQAEIYHLDLDHPSKVLSMQEVDSKVQEVVEVVTTAKLITDVVTTASQVSASSATISAAKPSFPTAAPIVVAAYTRRRKGEIIRDPKEELSSKTPTETPKLKDKGKGILIETLKPMKKKDQIELDAEYARKLHEEINKDHKEINKDIDWDAAIDHVNKKSKNPQYIKRYQGMKKRPQTERMSYDEICLIFQARFDANMRFLFKAKEEMEEEDQERLEVVDDEDDDVFIEATPLARKVPVMDYHIVLIDNKPRFKIIKADETHQLYISFITLLKNFDREDLENLWGIVKKRFSTSKPTNFSDEYLLLTLKTMFEKPNRQDAVWKSQRSVHGLALKISTFKVYNGTTGECNKTSSRRRKRIPNVVEPELRTILEVAPMADNRTTEELLQVPTEGYGEAIVISKITTDHFEIKTNLLQLVQANPYHGFDRENPHTHINNFKRITSTLKFRDVPNDVIKLMMFPYSLEGSARGGYLLSKTTREALQIIENKSKFHYSRNKLNVSRMNTTSRKNACKTDDRIDKLAYKISTLVDIFSKKVITPATVKAVEESCVTCVGNHTYYNCDATNSNQSSVCVAMGT